MTKDEALRWHAALAAASGLLSGAIARNSQSHRLTESILSMLRPVVRELEVEALTYAARDKVEKEAAAKPQRVQRRRRT
jgi:hypothetical protein